ncbi:hypothetical protein AMTR_s00009p00267750 [Amborella trichopoda]|uniref:LanC-like protein GCL2 n=1 Tax=Amborella trichopoda TaxID=13333 RepID=W1NIB0_AMBTC|nr:hypothetical protein AMTR_s00009p00267750 [Amborella trichopoda]
MLSLLVYQELPIDSEKEIVKETWVNCGGRVKDTTLYTGALGTAYLLFKAYQVTNNKDDLSLCTEIIASCDVSSRGMREDVTFICGQAGIYALGAVAAKCIGDQSLLDRYLSLFRKIPKRIESYDIPYELLYGRSGFLWACAFLNQHIGPGTISSDVTAPIVKDIFKEGRRLSHGGCPLVYVWHGKKYWGAAHGLAGIMHVLMHFELSAREEEDVKGTLRYMMQNRFPSGNYPSSEGSTTDRLVHWCHGAPGVALTMCRAVQAFGDKEFMDAAVDATDVVWKRGLLRRVGICHGVSGNAYVFLALYRLLGKEEYLYKAKAFACFLLDCGGRLISSGEMHGGDRSLSLFEGMAGTAHLFLDMTKPSDSRFPAYELF